MDTFPRAADHGKALAILAYFPLECNDFLNRRPICNAGEFLEGGLGANFKKKTDMSKVLLIE